MIKRPTNWDSVKEFTDRPRLPLGAYVCKVRKAVIQDNDYGEQLCLLFDIEEGEFAGFFSDDFKENTNADKKWRGVLRQFIPKDDGSEKDEWTKSSFKGMVTSFEKSNPGYKFDWVETSLVGKMVGILFRNEEWEYDGKTGWAVRPFKAISTDSVRNNDFRVPKDKPLKNKPAGSAYGTTYGQGFTELADDDDELPF